MRYTRGQYNAIVRDAESTIKECERPKTSANDSGKFIPFKCTRTACSFCPFTYGDNECNDLETFYRDKKFYTARTADDWRQWLEKFQIDNDPDRPYTVEIPANAVDNIDEALNLGCVDTATAKLLESIQKQINDQNRN